MKFTHRQQGMISVFLSLILAVTFLFSAIVVDGGRIYAAKNIVSGAGQMALNAGLSQYDKALKDAYGLIAMSKTPEEMIDNLNTYFVDSLGACGIDEEDLNTAIVFLNQAADEKIKASAVENTEIARGYVMEQQVLDYMKFRAPVTFGMTIADKLANAKELKQLKVVSNDQIATTKALSDLEKQLKKLKKAVDHENEEYNKLKDYKDKLAEIEQLYRLLAVKACIANSLLLVASQDAGDLPATMKAFNANFETLRGIMNAMDSDPLGMTIAAFGPFLTGEGYSKTIEDDPLSSSKDDFLEEYAASEDEDAEEGELDEEKKAEYEQIWDTYHNYYPVFNGTYREMLTGSNPDEAAAAHGIWDKMHYAAEIGEEKAGEVLKHIEKVNEKLEDVRSKYGTWVQHTEELSNEETKKSMKEPQKDFEAYVSDNPDCIDGIEKLKKQAEENQAFYKDFKLYIENSAFGDNGVLLIGSINSVNKEVFGICSSSQELNEKFGYGKDGIFNYYKPGGYGKDYMNYLPEPLNDLTICPFYKVLEKFTEESDKARAKEENKKAKDGLSKQLERFKELLLSSDLDGIKGALADKTLPSGELGAATKGAPEGNNMESSDMTNDDGRDKLLDQGDKTLNTDTSLLEQLVDIANKAGDGIAAITEDIYITEYMMNMFSYYTINKQMEQDGTVKERKAEDIKSLSNYDLTQDVIYRAEVEYILWGNKENVAQNVNNTKAVIFAIQFVGNLVFAFTDKTVTEPATTISSFFGNPIIVTIVKIVLETVVATVETVRDLEVLCNGGSVLLIKNLDRDEWRTDLENPSSWVGKNKNSGSGMAFTYRDYLWIMVCANCMTNNKYSMLARAADCAQVNLNKTNGGEKGDKYNLMKMPTMLQIDAQVEMKTYIVTDFFNAASNAHLDTDGNFTIKYKGIQGY